MGSRLTNPRKRIERSDREEEEVGKAFGGGGGCDSPKRGKRFFTI